MKHTTNLTMDKRPSFKEFVGFTHDGGPLGDFAADVHADKTFPENIRFWEELDTYLRFTCGCCPGAVVAARTLWNEYAAMFPEYRAP